MEDFINKWIYFELLYYKDKFQTIDNLEFVHPNDRDFVKTHLTNTFYQCIGVEGEYLKVKSKNNLLRIKPRIIKGYLPTPKFIWGDKVIEKGKLDTEAVIDDFFWHQNKEQYLFYVRVNGKRKSKQLTDNELLESLP